jgi:SRSO17 transposase
MTDAQIERCRKRMDQFLTDLVEPIGRSERRHWAAVYVRGLLLDGERKSIEPLAARLPDGNAQALQQFIGQSPWEWDAVWERLGKRMTAELEPESAWVVDDTGFPKQGSHSVGVSRQYSPVFERLICPLRREVEAQGTKNATLARKLLLQTVLHSSCRSTPAQ